MADNIKVEQNFQELKEKIDNIPSLDLKNIKKYEEELFDEVDTSSLIGIGLTIAISAFFLYHYR